MTNYVDTIYGEVAIVSRAERLFFEAWHFRYGKNIKTCLRPQFHIGKYRVDFAHVPTRTVIEIDGSEHYLDPDVIVKDRKRQRDIESKGWSFIRFGSRKVFSGTVACVDEVRTVLASKGEFAPVEVSQYRVGDRIYDASCGEGIVLKSEIDAGAEFITIQFRDRRLRFNMSVAEPRLWRGVVLKDEIEDFCKVIGARP